MRNRLPSFDVLEGRRLLSGTQVDPNYDLNTGWIPIEDPVPTPIAIMPPPPPAVVYPFPGPPTYDPVAAPYPP